MRPKEIQKLIEIVEKSQISELEVTRWGRKVSIRKHLSNDKTSSGKTNENIIVAQPSTPPEPAQTPPSSQSVEKTAPQASNGGMEIKSPMVGTFYQAPSPDADPYVKKGDKISQGQVLCIIEAMKLMNEIEAEFPCRIVDVLVENAQPVEYNQPLFKIEKV
ncbi:acetyl-CoA carboxylase biotin carboxyl carrier protein [candidate division KSB1 bacterium]|nr:acetyl-CoA carboxylase biotin carboxyl carrier protein [candidate division KSB1 bacterium]